MIMKRKKKIISKFIPEFINQFHSDVSQENIKNRYKKIEISSWFKIQEKDSLVQGKYETHIDYDKLEKNNYKSKTISLKLDKYQKKIMDDWFEAFRLAYNFSIFLLKKKTYSFYDLRKKLKQIKYDIQNKYGINLHVLDRAIHLAVTNNKSALSNKKNGNIKKYRLRYWRKNQNIKIIKVEKNEMNHIKLFKSFNGYDEKRKIDIYNAEAECIFRYDKNSKQYALFYPIKIVQEAHNKTNKTISLDPGLRTFLTGVSNDKTVKICDEITKKIKPLLLKIDRFQSKNKLKMKRKYEAKIKYLINDLHWKSINYLTSNYDNIIIGNLSTKDAIKGNRLHDMTKRCLLNMSLFKFKLRLKYKCSVKNKNYKEVDESYTSKTCSKCGIINEELKSNKVFKCVNERCKFETDRDINGARNIYLKSFMV